MNIKIRPVAHLINNAVIIKTFVGKMNPSAGIAKIRNRNNKQPMSSTDIQEANKISKLTYNQAGEIQA
ncbi:hypothetical protein SG34_003160 [Thalassomonas viridans]|uniref:Uncharacterized protein n=1 Tax=Thalassomonas viridans TaxID=137584 RepID=A0AAE9Z4J9_9GAMM|nr:hypothetical protein [Thalassomonas viridans]WDE05944.1 hypothetical protein SG34_003160 [Thalassomonas viridans]